MVRVLLDSSSACYTDTLELIVGEAKGTRWQSDYHPTVWNDDLNVLEHTTFYKVGRRGDWYVDSKAELKRITELEDARRKSRRNANADWRGAVYYQFPNGEAARKIVLPALRRNPGCKSKKASDIIRVYKEICEGRNKYFIETARCRWQLKVKEA
jgi:hypothetical protein